MLTSPNRRCRATALVVLALAACSPASHEERIADYNKLIAPEGELTPTHLFIKWPQPSPQSSLPPVTLKIPVEFLESRPLFMGDKREIFSVYITFAFPDFTPWQPKPAKAEEWAQRRRTRVLVTLRRDIEGGSGYRKGTRNQIAASLGPTRDPSRSHAYVLDGEVAGLERHTLRRCYTPNEGYWAPSDAARFQERLATKPADDTSAPNCLLDREETILLSPTSQTSDDEGVTIDCKRTGCTATFRAGKRAANLEIPIDELARWADRVEPARRLINSFIVSD